MGNEPPRIVVVAEPDVNGNVEIVSITANEITTK
jgi:hypothetical protein